MVSAPRPELVQQFIQDLCARIASTRHRRVLVLSGQLNWAQEALAPLVSQILDSQLLLVSDTDLFNGIPAIPAQKLRHELGTEVQYLVWNAHEGFNPDAFGAASGLVKGGGLMILLLPEMANFNARPDPDYLRMCSFDGDLERYGSRFHQRLFRLMCEETGCLLIEQSDAENLKDRIDALALPIVTQTDGAKSEESLFIGDQKTAFEAVRRVAEGHRNRPLVMTANRGRGKSSLLGIAAARLDRRVIITAPQRRSVDSAFEHFERTLGSAPNKPGEAKGELLFVAPDELVSGQYEAELIFVDEAAALPVELLLKILKRYSRIVFSTTVHGYEGTGQGFAVRFSQALDQRCPGWKTLHLQKAIRWGDNDPMESFVFRSLVLDAEFPELDAPSRSSLGSSIRQVSQDELLENETLLSQIMALLVLAHYQTSPSDLRMLLDHPDLILFVCERNRQILGVVFALKESLSEHLELHDAVVSGQRRLKGQLTPQTLASFSLNKALLSLSFLRVVRITVHPQLFGLGIGSQLMTHLKQFATESGLDYLSVSYAYSTSVYRFWQRNGFATVKAGYRLDASSGSHSLLALNDLVNSEHLHSVKLQFGMHFLYGLPRYFKTLNWQLVIQLIQEASPSSVCLNQLDKQALDYFISGSRTENDTLESIEKLVLIKLGSKQFLELTSLDQQLLIQRTLQQQDWQSCVQSMAFSGKKEALEVLRAAVSRLCADI